MRRAIDYARLPTAVLAFAGFAALACTPVERETEAEPSPSPSPDAVIVEAEPSADSRELGPLLGGAVTPRSPALARWAASVEFDQHRYVTMEHTAWSRIAGSVVVRLEPGGRASACATVREVSGGEMGRYQSHDGKDHRSSSEHAVIVGMTGTWANAAQGPELELVFDRMNWQGCAVDPSTPAFAQPPLRCFGFAPTAKVPSDALLCEVPELAFAPLASLALLIGDTPRAGSWAQRFDLSGHGVAPPEGATPWLLLGAEPGLSLRIRDHDRDAEPLVIERAEVGDPVAPPR